MSLLNNQQLFKTPFRKEYWRQAASELKSLRMLIIAALFIGIRIAAAKYYIPLPVMGTQHIYFSFLINALGTMIYGPVVGIISGGVSDIIGAILFPKGPFFIGYTITSMMGSFIYGIFLYKARLSIARLVFCKFSVNMISNVILNSLWPAILMNKGFFELMLLRIPKNVIMLPIEVFLLYIFFLVMIPILKREHLITPMPYEKHMKWF